MEKDLVEKLKDAGLARQPYWSTKYLKNVENLSKPEYKVKEELDVYALVRDGTKLCMDIFRPDVEGKKFPALVAWSDYSKAIQSSIRQGNPREGGIRHYMQCVLYDQTIEAGDLDFFTTRGYAFVIPDPRGCGKSEGEYYGMYNEQEQKDAFDIIEWTAQQPWCDGNVGMVGYSYFGMIQPLVAARRPPHLKTIMPFFINEDFYNRAYNGGILDDFYHGFYHLNAVNNGVSEAEREFTEEELKHKIEERLQDPDIRSNSFYVKILSCWPPRMNTWFFDLLLHPFDGPFYHVRSEKKIRNKIQVPVNFSSYEGFADPKLNVPKKLFTVADISGQRFTCPMRYGSEEMLRWYDHWLKGVDTGIMDEPPIKLFVHGVNKYRFEKEWPLERTKWTKIYLERYETLATELIPGVQTPPDILVHKPASIVRINGPEDVPFIRYATVPLTKPLEVTGPVALYLYAAIDVEDANFHAKLYDAFPDGGKRLVSSGNLRASHRMLRKGKSKPWLPVHDHTKAVPVKPSEINEYVIKMSVASNVFQTGHRVELEIPSMNLRPPGYVEAQYGLMPSALLTTYKIYRDAKYPSHLLLPVIPETPSELWLE